VICSSKDGVNFVEFSVDWRRDDLEDLLNIVFDLLI